MSHIFALDHAIREKWDHVLIMEDDMEWNKFDENYPKLLELMKKPYDVIVLGGILVSHNYQTSKLYQCNSTGAYLVSQHYYQTLIQNFKEGFQKLTNEINTPLPLWGIMPKSKDPEYRIDVYWHKLQERDNWFIVPLCYSSVGYSDVSKGQVDWQPYFLK
jgi:GR25 family glycosyltransferase involved in LPS biosynthesis